MKNEKLKIKNGKGPRITRITTDWFYFFNHGLLIAACGRNQRRVEGEKGRR